MNVAVEEVHTMMTSDCVYRLMSVYVWDLYIFFCKICFTQYTTFHFEAALDKRDTPGINVKIRVKSAKTSLEKFSTIEKL